MSMVVEEPETKDVLVFTKGADSAILPLIKDKNTEVYRSTEAHMESFAERGMRTLVFAYKRLVGHSYNQNSSDAFFEGNLDLLGASGVEDLL